MRKSVAWLLVLVVVLATVAMPLARVHGTLAYSALLASAGAGVGWTFAFDVAGVLACAATGVIPPAMVGCGIALAA